MPIKEVVSSEHGSHVEVINRDSDPMMWIVETSKKFLGIKMKKSSRWFSNKEEAYEYANTLKLSAA